MREITVKLYQFDELSDKAKEKAREWFRDDGGMMQQDCFDQTLEDAERIGLKVFALDDRGVNRGEFVTTGLDCARLIRKEHGETCKTYQTAARYIDALEAQDEDTIEDTDHEFLHDLLEDYRIMFNKDIEYRYADEQVDEDIRANEYEFTEDGKRA